MISAGARALMLLGASLLPLSVRAVDPLSVEQIGSFYVGGRPVHLSDVPARPRVHRADISADVIHPDGDFVYGQVYVQFVKLAKPRAPYPLMLWHGGSLSGVSFESTPDGREGWRMDFLRAGYSVYVPDAPQSGRSPWARFPEIAPEEPSFRTAAFAWEVFRIGPPGSYASPIGTRAAYPDTRFPVTAFEQFARQVGPRFRASDELTRAAYSELVDRVCPCILLTHSASGPLGEEIARTRPALVRALISIEPSAGAPLTSDAPSRESRTPRLIVWGDHLDQPSDPNGWARDVQAARDNAAVLRAAGTSVDWIDLPRLGIRGNSHMLMMDNNSADIARLIDQWIRGHVH